MTKRELTVAMVQDNPLVGAIEAIRERLFERVEEAKAAGADLVVFPEMATVGYPPKDLLDLAGFVEGNVETVISLATRVRGIAVLIGHVAPNDGPRGKPLYNAASLLADGRVVHTWRKALLPSYDVFDEARYFEPGAQAPVVDFEGWRIGVTICEDIWTDPEWFGRALYHREPAREQIAAGADVLVNVSASPYSMDKLDARRRLVCELAREGGVPVLYCNQFGANDELVFDGGSFAVDGEGRLIAQAPHFDEGMTLVTLGDDERQPECHPPVEGCRAVLRALELGLRDYMDKCGFSQVVVGLSGGIDSAVVCAVAARALGPDKVVALLMPSPFSSDHSLVDARALARNLGVEHHVVPIDDTMKAYEATLARFFEGRKRDVTEENIQARIRGNILMAWSNKFGHMVLSTGNKSELAVGYCTLYGDMAGGLSLISDLPKMMVYDVARLINADAGREVVPENILDKPPSAELAPDQKDEDTLPPYPVLDEIVRLYVEEHESVEQIAARGHDPDEVERVVGLIHRNEYKRRQSAPGIKVTSKAFGFGRRFPIAHRRR
ncbi:MAG: NAD+ synthase [Myxococcota bacterium]